MIRRILSLAYGVIILWAGYLLMCRSVFAVSPSDMVLGCASGVGAFYRAAVAVGAPLLAMIVLLSKFPVVKRAWANFGSIAGAAVILLFCAIFLGAGASGSVMILLVG